VAELAAILAVLLAIAVGLAIFFAWRWRQAERDATTISFALSSVQLERDSRVSRLDAVIADRERERAEMLRRIHACTGPDARAAVVDDLERLLSGEGRGEASAATGVPPGPSADGAPGPTGASR
jgi:hypothetical protein